MPRKKHNDYLLIDWVRGADGKKIGLDVWTFRPNAARSVRPDREVCSLVFRPRVSSASIPSNTVK